MRSPGKHSARLLRWTTRRVALPMAQAAPVEGRLRAVLGKGGRRGEVTRGAALTGGLALLAAVLALAVLRLTPRPFVTTITVDGVRVQAHVWQSLARNGKARSLTPRLTASRTPDPRQHWEVDILHGSIQYGLLQSAPMPFGLNMPLKHVGPTASEISSLEMAPAHQSLALYPTPRSYADISGQLCRYETLDERVTFRNLHFVHTAAGLWMLSTPRPLSVTTPSGVTVTLLLQPGGPNDFTSLESSSDFLNSSARWGLHCWVQLTPNSDPHVLPASALCRTYHAPATVRLLWPTGQLPMMSVLSAGSQSSQLGVAVPLPAPAGGTLKSLTFIVRQRVDIQKFPLSFTVPLVTQAWPVFPRTAPKRHEKHGKLGQKGGVS